MFRDARALDRQRTAGSFDQAMHRYAGDRERWYTGTIDSVDTRLANCERLLHHTRATMARFSINDSGRYLHAREYLETDRRALLALREDLLTGAAGREDVVGPPGWRSSKTAALPGYAWDIDDDENHIAYDNDWNEAARAYQHPDDGNWYVKHADIDQPSGPYADLDTAKHVVNDSYGHQAGDNPEYGQGDPTPGAGKAAPGHGTAKDQMVPDDKNDYDSNGQPSALANEQAVHQHYQDQLPPTAHPGHAPLPGKPKTWQEIYNGPGQSEPTPQNASPNNFNDRLRGKEVPQHLNRDIPGTGPFGRNTEAPKYDQVSDKYWQGDQSKFTPNHSEGQMSLFNETPHEQLPDLKPYLTPDNRPRDRKARLAGTDRRWVELEAARFVAANRDAWDDSHELAVRAANHADIKTSTFPGARSAAVSEAFVARVGDLGRQSYRPPVRTAAAFRDFDDQALFL